MFNPSEAWAVGEAGTWFPVRPCCHYTKTVGTENGWHSVIPGLRGLRKKGCEAEASLGYLQSSRSDLASKIEEEKQKKAETELAGAHL